ncbi:MAG: T9SS type A sorting domain-containing protein [Bacteroidetes bacterium]|nr:T9SS type A sorting domain-containing protein [Bacteroidota bacterium]
MPLVIMRRYLLSLVSILILLSGFVQYANAQNTFRKRYSAEDWDKGVRVFETDSGGFILAHHSYGSSNGPYSVHFTKLDSLGQVQWSKLYDGDFRWLSKAIKTGDGNFVYWGDKSIVALDRIGTIQWNKRYRAHDIGWGQDIKQTYDNGFIIAGQAWDDWLFAKVDPCPNLLKLDSTGVIEWKLEYALGYMSQCVEQSYDSGYIVLITNKYNTNIVKVDKSGTISWCRNLQHIWQFLPKAILQTSDSNFLVIGGTQDSAYNNKNVLILKFDKSGNKIWSRIYGSNADEEGINIIETADNNYLFTGLSTDQHSKIFLVKTDTAGKILWSKNYCESHDEEVFDLIELSDRRIAILGATEDSARLYNDLQLIITDSVGNSVYAKNDTSITDTAYSLSFGNFTYTYQTVVFIVDTDSIYTNSTSLIEQEVDLSPIADFNFTVSNDTVYLTNNSIRETSTSWDMGDGNTIVAANAKYVYGTSGLFTICLNVYNDCGQDSMCKSINVLFTDISEGNSGFYCNLYPNPTSNTLFCDYSFPDGLENNKIQIYNILGQIVFEKDIVQTQGVVNINTKAFPNGIYQFVISKDNSLIFSEKIIVAR